MEKIIKFLIFVLNKLKDIYICTKKNINDIYMKIKKLFNILIIIIIIIILGCEQNYLKEKVKTTKFKHIILYSEANKKIKEIFTLLNKNEEREKDKKKILVKLKELKKLLSLLKESKKE